MSLTRSQLLQEMGIAPVWRLRENPAGSHAAPEAGEAAYGNDAPAIEAMAPMQAAREDESVPRAAVSRGVVSPAANGAVASMGWDALQQGIADCRACVLCEQRKQAVPGVGDREADWLFIGEGPGAEEDARGEPFVGQAGKLLDAMLAAIDLRRGENVYIANAVKCRPPGNRTPEAGEMAACRPWLQRQIALIRPKLIVLLGRAAVHAVLQEERSLAGCRGKTFEYRDGELVVPVIVTYHPAYLLRNLPDKAKAWEDLCLARRLMRERQASGLDLPF